MPLPISFTAKVDLYDFGRMAYTVVHLPPEIVSQLDLKNHPRLRITGTVQGVPYEGACQPTGKGWYLLLSRQFLRQADLQVDDMAELKLSIADQNAVDVPFELVAALAQRHGAQKKWDGLTAGKRRSFAYRVASAKRPKTREQRTLEVLDAVMDL